MFLLTEEHLLTLWEINQFPVPRDRWVFFGLRGCLPVNDNDQSFSHAHSLKVEDVDYIHTRCTLVQWCPGNGFALFPGSTVPHRKHVESSRPLAGVGANQLLTAYVTSEAGVALLLDQHVNRPGHVPKTLAQAVDRLARERGTDDPTSWSDPDERELIEAYLALRAGTNMTDSDKRAQVVLDTVSRGVISDRRGSFVA